jgi:energy-coupling factor transport system permease protein
MFKDITLGQYYPTGSVIHQLDPRTKINFTLVYIVLLFVVNNPVGYLIAIGILALVIALSKIPFVYIARGLKPLIFIIVLDLYPQHVHDAGAGALAVEGAAHHPGRA